MSTRLPCPSFTGGNALDGSHYRVQYLTEVSMAWGPEEVGGGGGGGFPSCEYEKQAI
jgi:hypothetical protein